jgi:restriction endonuclease S subunit
MELKPGYKQTEVGVIPEDWEVAEIGDSKPFVTSGSRGWAKFYSDTGEPFIRISNLSRESIYLDLTDLKQVKLPAEAREGTRTQLQDNDVVISITADIGIIGYVNGCVPKPSYINQHIALVRFDSAKTSSQFISYFLTCENSQRQFRGATDQGAKAGMSLETIRKIPIARPPLPEQRAIAETLSDADALIESLEKLLTKKRQLERGSMQELLTGRKRLPGFSGDWKVYRFGEIAQPRKERVDSRQTGVEDFCIELEHIEQETGCLVGYTKTGEGSSLKSVFRKHDVLFGKLRAYLRKYWLANCEGVCSTEIWVLVAKRPLITPEFLFQLVKTDRFVEAASSQLGLWHTHASLRLERR